MKFNVEMSTDEKIARFRDLRDTLLSETDNMVVDDRPVENKQAWRDYRQALRDLTSHESWPDAEFPEKPA